MTGSAPLDLLIIALPLLLVRLWWTGSRAKELAVTHARQACRQRQLQFLDQTAALIRLRIARNNKGEVCLRREYRFEFTDQGEFRDTAQVILEGYRLRNVHFPYTRDADGHRIYVQ